MAQVLTEMVTEYCCTCGIAFCMTENFYNNRRKDHEIFWCPAGHQQAYLGKTEEEKLKEKLRRSELELEEAEGQLERQRGYSEELERSRSALKGQITKTKRRIAKGVCPCCNRTFSNIARHMESRHPDYSEVR